MRCPIDKTDMIVVEHQRIELDHCLRCSGVWFDAGELDLLVSSLVDKGIDQSVRDLLTPNEARVSEAKRKCPVCRRKMDKIWLGKDPRVLIDSCPAGDGLWFDGGELHQVLRQIESTGPRDIISFLGEAFQSTHQVGEKDFKNSSLKDEA
jgi:Zn-finger nucleic acid-binding protein